MEDVELNSDMRLLLNVLKINFNIHKFKKKKFISVECSFCSRNFVSKNYIWIIKILSRKTDNNTDNNTDSNG